MGCRFCIFNLAYPALSCLDHFAKKNKMQLLGPYELACRPGFTLDCCGPWLPRLPPGRSLVVAVAAGQ
jgi:hypothetical protein